MKIINPATEELINDIAEDTPESVNQKFSLLKMGQKAWAKVPVEKRIAAIELFYNLLEEHKDELANTLTGEMEFIYALLRKDGALIGSCYFQVVRFKGTNLTAYFPKDDGSIKNKLINLTGPVAIAGNTVTFIPGAASQLTFTVSPLRNHL